MIKVGVRHIAQFAVPYVETITGAGAREIDTHFLVEHFAVSGI